MRVVGYHHQRVIHVVRSQKLDQPDRLGEVDIPVIVALLQNTGEFH